MLYHVDPARLPAQIRVVELRLANYLRNLETCLQSDREGFRVMIQDAERELAELKRAEAARGTTARIAFRA